MRTGSNKNDVLFERLKLLCKGYSTGKFDDLFPYLSDDCVFESQWVFIPNTGKEEVIDYLVAKGETLRRNGSFAECTIVEFVGSFNPIKNANIHLNGGEPQIGNLGLWYDEGKLAVLMRQQLEDELVSIIVEMDLDENDLISRIDLCMPELFRFKHYAGPFNFED